MQDTRAILKVKLDLRVVTNNISSYEESLEDTAETLQELRSSAKTKQNDEEIKQYTTAMKETQACFSVILRPVVHVIKPHRQRTYFSCLQEKLKALKSDQAALKATLESLQG